MKTHLMSNTPEYFSWARMKQRCSDPKGNRFHIYGSIKVCDRWNSFENFFADMGKRPPGMSLDRIDNTKGYFKENCRWATSQTQNRNRRDNVVLEFNGKSQCVAAWAEETGISRATILQRYHHNWPIEKILSKIIRAGYSDSRLVGT